MVERSFGSGAVKITPAHDHNDYDCGKRHSLPFVEMMDDEGNITDVSAQFKVWREGRGDGCGRGRWLWAGEMEGGGGGT